MNHAQIQSIPGLVVDQCYFRDKSAWGRGYIMYLFVYHNHNHFITRVYKLVNPTWLHVSSCTVLGGTSKRPHPSLHKLSQTTVLTKLGWSMNNIVAHVIQIKATKWLLLKCLATSVSLLIMWKIVSVQCVYMWPESPTSPAAVDNTSVTTAYKQYSLTTSHVPFVKKTVLQHY